MSPENKLPRIRVAAVIVQDRKVLLVRHVKEAESYWMLPGGGVDYGESLAEALQRELREEIRVEVSVGPLLLVNDSIPPDRHRHIVNLYFRATITSGTPVLGDDRRLAEVAFHPLHQLDRLPMRPNFGRLLRQRLQQAPAAGPAYFGNHWSD